MKQEITITELTNEGNVAIQEQINNAIKLSRAGRVMRKTLGIKFNVTSQEPLAFCITLDGPVGKIAKMEDIKNRIITDLKEANAIQDTDYKIEVN